MLLIERLLLYSQNISHINTVLTDIYKNYNLFINLSRGNSAKYFANCYLHSFNIWRMSTTSSFSMVMREGHHDADAKASLHIFNDILLLKKLKM